MSRIAFLPLMIFMLVGTMVWVTAKYAEMQEQFRLQRCSQPRCRPVLSRPIVIRGGKR